MSWLTGNLVIDWMAIVGTTFCVGGFLAFVGWALWDKFRPQRGEHFRPIDEEPAPAVSEPAPVAVKSGRSPFAPRREAK